MKHSLRNGSILAAVFLIGFAELAANSPESLALLAIKSHGAAPATATAITEKVSALLRATGKYELQEPSKVTRAVAEVGNRLLGCTPVECAIEVGRVLGVRKVVLGSLVMIDPIAHQVTYRMIDVASARVIHGKSAFFKGAITTLVEKAVPALLRDVTGN